MHNPFSLEGKTILVTGASSGIGRSTAIECSKMGAINIITGRNQERLYATYNDLSGEGHQLILADLNEQNDIENIVNSISSPIDGCVLCAGISQIKPIKRIDRNGLCDILNSNTVAPILLTSLLIKNKKFSKLSSIVFISSMAGPHIVNAGEATYSTSKGAITAFAKVAALELAAQNIRVNCISPGVVETPLLNVSNNLFSEDQLKDTMLGRYPLKRFGKPEDIAFAVIYLLSEASSWVTGSDLVIDGGYTLS
mgnify:CR=1 FL=1